MKKLILFLLTIICAAGIIAVGYFIWNYRAHYGDWAKEHDIADILESYTISSIPSETAPQISAPELPDITPYTIKALKDKMPKPRAGLLLVQNLEEGYRKMRSQLAFFGDRQERLDPLSIVIAGGVYDLATITKEIADETLIKRQDDGIYILYVPLSIRAEATLLIQEGETLLLSETTGALLSNFGDVFIMNATVKAWNTADNKPALFKDMDKFRPHITSWCGSHLNIAGSTIAHLGYQASKSYGVSYTACTDTLYRVDYGHLPGATGWIIGNVFDDIYFGFYSYEADDVVILRNLYKDNIVYGVDPHDRSRNLIIAYNTARGAKQKHGIIISREVSNSFIFNNLTEENAGSGIMIDRNSHDNIIAYNISQKNEQDGLTFYESPNNISYQNTLVYNKNTGMRIRNSWNVTSKNDVINYNDVAGIQLYSLYLTPTRGATYRDLELDPYIQRAGVTLIKPELVGNKVSNFKLEDFNNFQLYTPRLYQSPERNFAGDMKGIDHEVQRNLSDDTIGLRIKSKKQADQNLIRNSEEPR